MCRPPPLLNGQQFGLKPVHHRAQVRPRRGVPLRHRLLAGLTRLCQPQRAIRIVHRRSRPHLQRCQQRGSTLTVGLRTRCHPRRDGPQVVRDFEQFGTESATKFVRARVVRAMGPPYCCADIFFPKHFEEAVELALVRAQRGVEDCIEHRLAGLGEQEAERGSAHRIAAAGPLKHARARLRDEFARGLLVQHVERRRHAGLKRETRQKVLAKRMNGEDFQPAWCLQRLGEQSPGSFHVFRSAEAGADLGDTAFEFLVRQHRPLAQLLEQPSLHFRRGGLGKGQAQDSFWVGLRQQEARDAIGQRIGLSGACIGRDPGRILRVGRDDRRLLLDLAGVPVAHSSAASQPPSDHSRTRAR